MGILLDLSLKNLDKEHSINFKKIAERISSFLSIELNINSINVYFQEPNSSIEIPTQGINFGCIISSNSIVLANWIKNLSSQERKIIIHFLFSKEIFRINLLKKITFNHSYGEIIEMWLSVLSILWCIKDLNLNSYFHRSIGYILQRMIFSFDKKTKLNWDKEFTIIYYSEISLKKLFDRILSIIKKGKYENWSAVKMESSFHDFVDTLEPSQEFHLLPIQMKERYFAILEKLLQVGFRDSSARKIGTYLHREHDVINNAYREMIDQYVLYWLPRVDYLALKLYPYTFRLTISDKQITNELLEIFKKNPYIFNLYVTNSRNNNIIYASFNSPYIIHHQLEKLLERYSKKEKITDYFLQSPRRRTIFGTIATDKLELAHVTYDLLISQQKKLPIKTFTFLDEVLYPHHEKKTKKAYFAEEVLGFLSTIRARFLPQGMYTFHNVEFIELCNKYGVNTNETETVMSYINKMEHRCQRLGVLDYKLTLWVKSSHSTNLNFELLVDPMDNRVKELTNNLKSFASLSKTEFVDRVILTFQGIKYDKYLVNLIEKQISSYDIEFMFTELNRNVDFQRCVCFHQLYDYDNQRWKF